MFFWNSLAFLMIQQMLAIWSLVPLPFLNQLEHLEVHGSHIAEVWFKYGQLALSYFSAAMYSSEATFSQFRLFLIFHYISLGDNHLSY